jgi:hypothetical protein
MYPFYEKLVKWQAIPDRPGLKNVCIHKGLFPPSVERSSRTCRLLHVGDVGKAAKDWPQLNFVIYHSAYRWVAGPAARAAALGPAAAHRPRRLGHRPRRHPAEYGVKNVYGDLGQIFAHSNMAEPRVRRVHAWAHDQEHGRRPRGVGHRRAVDRRAAVADRGAAPHGDPEDIQKKYGLAPMGRPTAR